MRGHGYLPRCSGDLRQGWVPGRIRDRSRYSKVLPKCLSGVIRQSKNHCKQVYVRKHRLTGNYMHIIYVYIVFLNSLVASRFCFLQYSIVIFIISGLFCIYLCFCDSNPLHILNNSYNLTFIKLNCKDALCASHSRYLLCLRRWFQFSFLCVVVLVLVVFPVASMVFHLKLGFPECKLSQNALKEY